MRLVSGLLKVAVVLAALAVAGAASAQPPPYFQGGSIHCGDGQVLNPHLNPGVVPPIDSMRIACDFNATATGRAAPEVYANGRGSGGMLVCPEGRVVTLPNWRDGDGTTPAQLVAACQRAIANAAVKAALASPTLADPTRPDPSQLMSAEEISKRFNAGINPINPGGLTTAPIATQPPAPENKPYISAQEIAPQTPSTTTATPPAAPAAPASSSDWLWTLVVSAVFVVLGYIAAGEGKPGGMFWFGLAAAVFASVNWQIFHRTSLGLQIVAALPMAMFAGWVVTSDSGRASADARIFGAVIGLLAFVASILFLMLLNHVPVLTDLMNWLGETHGRLIAWSLNGHMIKSAPIFLQPAFIAFVLAAAWDFVYVLIFAGLIAAALGKAGFKTG